MFEDHKYETNLQNELLVQYRNSHEHESSATPMQNVEYVCLLVTYCGKWPL